MANLVKVGSPRIGIYSSSRRCLSKALLESDKKLAGRLPVTLILGYNVLHYSLHRMRANSIPPGPFCTRDNFRIPVSVFHLQSTIHIIPQISKSRVQIHEFSVLRYSQRNDLDKMIFTHNQLISIFNKKINPYCNNVQFY